MLKKRQDSFINTGVNSDVFGTGGLVVAAYSRRTRARKAKEPEGGLGHSRGRLARRLQTCNGQGAPTATAVDEHRSIAPDDPRRRAGEVANCRPLAGRQKSSESRVAPTAPMAGCAPRTETPEETVRACHVVERQHVAARGHGQERPAAVGLRAFGGTVPALQTRSRGLSRRRCAARAPGFGSPDGGRAQGRPPGGETLRVAYRFRAPAMERGPGAKATCLGSILRFQCDNFNDLASQLGT